MSDQMREALVTFIDKWDDTDCDGRFIITELRDVLCMLSEQEPAKLDPCTVEQCARVREALDELATVITRQLRPALDAARAVIDLINKRKGAVMSDRERIYELEQELDVFRWRDLGRDDEQPADGELLIATDGEARWMDMFHPGLGLPMTFFDGQESHTATHWHPILEIPARLRKS